MKLFVFILTVISISCAFEDKCRGAHLKSVEQKCVQAHGGDRALIEDLAQWKETNDENGKCFRNCLMQECEYFGSDGKIKPDVPKRLSWVLHGGNEANVKPIEEAATKCVASQTYSDSKCENTEIFARCMIRQLPVKYQLSKV